MFAPSSFVSARVRLSAPVCSVLIIEVVKDWRVLMTARLADSTPDAFWSVVSAVPSAVIAAVMLAVVTFAPPMTDQALPCVATVDVVRPKFVKFTAEPAMALVTDKLLLLLKLTVRELTANRFVPL